MKNTTDIGIPCLNLITTSIKFHKLITTFFHKEYCENVIVVSTNINTSQIIVKSDLYIFDCVTSLNISELDPGDKIIIQFKLIPKSISIMEIQPLILFFCNYSEYDDVSKRYILHNKTQFKLNNSTPNNVLRKPLPKILYRIGLIVLDTHTTILDTFKSKFKSNCFGKLFIYKVKSFDNTAVDFINAINYFNKYHEIDLICILTETLELEHLFYLSSKYVLKNFKYNKTHTISVSYQNGILSNSTDYSILISYGVRKLSIDKTMDIIHKIQFQYQKKIDDAILNGNDLFGKIIDAHLNYIAEFESDVGKLNTGGIKFMDKSIDIKNIDDDSVINNVENNINNIDEFIEIIDDL